MRDEFEGLRHACNTAADGRDASGGEKELVNDRPFFRRIPAWTGMVPFLPLALAMMGAD